MEEPLKILVAGMEREAFGEIHPMLSRAALEVYRVPQGKSAFELTDEIEFALILVGHPLPDIKLDDFLAILRRPSSASAESKVLVLSEDAEGADLQAFRGDGDSRVISMAGSMVAVLEQLGGHLGFAQRLSRRVMARLEVEIKGQVETRMCQSENVSATGMLVKTDRLYPIGTQVVVSFDLPSDGSPFATPGEIVRHADGEREGVRGLGIRFIHTRLADTRRLERYLMGLLGSGD